MSDLTIKAELFAFAAHAAIGQDRKYTGDAYIVHPVAVSALVKLVGGTDEMIAAALLHDVVEDTDIRLCDITASFGYAVADMVSGLTDISKPGDGNRATRKEIDRQHLSIQSPDTKTIKLADLIHNSYSIVKHDPKFAKVYMAEKKLLLEVLTEGNYHLYNKALKIVNNYYKDNKA